GGKTRMTGIYAALLIALVVLIFTGPLSLLPKAVLGAILILAGLSLFDFAAIRNLYRMSKSEFWVSMVAMLGVITVGVAAGIIVAVFLSILTLLQRISRPNDAILGLMSSTGVFVDSAEHEEARPVVGCLIYRFDSSLLFFNAEYFQQRVRHA